MDSQQTWVVVAAAPATSAPMRFHIKRADVQKFGYAMNCVGCRSVMTCFVARAHTSECRSWLEERLARHEETNVSSEEAKHLVDSLLAVASNHRSKQQEVVRPTTQAHHVVRQAAPSQLRRCQTKV